VLCHRPNGPNLPRIGNRGDDLFAATGRFNSGTARSVRMSTAAVRRRAFGVWRRVLDLSWPVMVQHVFRTLMRTTDVVVTGLFSPAAVAAVGLADLYARFPLRIGLGLGSGAIALSSQDTGSDALENRDEAVTHAVLLGLLAGVPFAAFGVLFGRQAIALLGAPENVARMGGAYLAVIFLSAPARHVALVAAQIVLAGALQGGSDTRTPFYARTSALFVFLLGFSYLTSVVLGWGVVGIYAGIVVHYLWMLVVIARGFVYGGWAERAATMMDERGSREADVDATD
jgi:Na+-driven multidrug efflux pump